ncbi:hypothetical protein HMPREF1584_01414, partial [Gardnerella vaginalis JCP8481A]
TQSPRKHKFPSLVKTKETNKISANVSVALQLCSANAEYLLIHGTLTFMLCRR